MSVTVQREAKLRVHRGLRANLPTPPNSFEPGRVYFCLDTGEMFVGSGLTNPMIQVVTATGGDVDSFLFTQSIPAADWVIVHNLNVSPAVVVEDSTNTQVFVETHFDTSNQVTLHFSAPESGRATLIG